MSNETTTSYRWEDGNVITRIDVRQQGNWRAVAYLYANESEEARPQRQEIRSAIRLKGWGTLSDFRDGNYALRITGLRSGAELISVLREQGFITTEPEGKTHTDATIKPRNMGEYIENNTLRSSGILYSIGNAMYIASGLARGKDKGQIGTGLAFGAGDALLATVGGKDDSRQFASLLRKLKTHYALNGVEIPRNASIFVETSNADKSIFERVHDVLHEYVNQIKCFFEVVGAFTYYKAGHDQKNPWKQATAVTFGTGFGASLLIKEKKIDEEKYAQAGPVERLWMKIQSNPLSVGGISGLSNTLFTTIGAINERKQELAKPLGQRTHHYRWDFAIPGVMLFGNVLYAMSKKTTGGDIKTDALVSDVYIVAAQILNKQPEGATREAAIESTAQFLGERPEIRDTHQQIIVRLKKEMQTQRQSPWFESRGLPPYTLVAKKRGKHREDTSEALEAPATVIHSQTVTHLPLQHAAAMAEPARN